MDTIRRREHDPWLDIPSWVLLIVVIGVSTWLLWATTGTNDVDLWLAWIQKLSASGPQLGYRDIHADYPPGTSLVLWIIGLIAGHTGMEPRSLLKLALLGWLLATTIGFLALSRRAGLAAFAHSALVLNAFGLMYLDILTAPFVIGAMWAARKGWLPAMVALLVSASLMKWQPMFLLPFAFVHVWRSSAMSRTKRPIVAAVLLSLAVVLPVVLAYGYSACYDALNRAGHHNDLSDYGGNPFWILTWFFEWTARTGQPHLSSDGTVAILAASRPIIRVSSLLSVIAYGTILRRFWKTADRTLSSFTKYSLAGYLAYFLFSVGVHENHLFLASLLGLVLACQDSTMSWVAAALAIIANLNLVMIYGWQGGLIDRVIAGVDVSVWGAVAISAVAGGIGFHLLRPPTSIRHVDASQPA